METADAKGFWSLMAGPRTSVTTRATAATAATLPAPVAAITTKTTARACMRKTIERVPGLKAAPALWTNPRHIPGPESARRAATKRRGAVDRGSAETRDRIRGSRSSDARMSVDRRKRSSIWSMLTTGSPDIPPPRYGAP